MSSFSHAGSCANSDEFSPDIYPYTVGELAFAAFGILVTLSMAVVYLAVVLKRRHTNKIAPWWIFGFAVIFSLVSFIMRLITDVLQDCNVLGLTTELSIWIAVVILFYGLAYLLWLAVLLFPLTMNVLELANMPRRLIAIGLGVLWTIIVVLWIAYTAIIARIQLREDVFGPPSEDLVHAYQGLAATQTVLYFIATVIACVLLVVALRKLRGVTIVTKGLHNSIYITIAFFLASSILSVVEVFYIDVALRQGTAAYIASTGILDIIFIFGAAYGMLFAAGSRTWANQTTYDPYATTEHSVSALDTNGRQYAGVSEMPGYGKPVAEMPGGRMTASYSQAAMHQQKGYGQSSELAGSTVAHELAGHARYEAPGHPLH